MPETEKLNLLTAAKFVHMQSVQCTIKQKTRYGYRAWINNDPTLPGLLQADNVLAEDQVVRARFFSIRGAEIALIYDDDPKLSDKIQAPKDFTDWEVFLPEIDNHSKPFFYPKPGGFVRWTEHLDMD